MVSLRHQRAINEYELGRLCERFGDVKSIRPCRESEYVHSILHTFASD
jgi:hypothetical protein